MRRLILLRLGLRAISLPELMLRNIVLLSEPLGEFVSLLKRIGFFGDTSTLCWGRLALSGEKVDTKDRGADCV